MIAGKPIYRYLQAAKDLRNIYQVRLTEKRLKIYTFVDLACDKRT